MHTENPSMPFQAPDGTWWSDDGKYYRSGNRWVLYPGTTSGNASSQQSQASTQQNSAQQPSFTGHPLGTVTPSILAAALEAFPQNSTEPYQQQPQLVFGTNRQTPGKAAAPVATLDPNFRAAASKDMMIGGFVKAMDDMASGRV